ncbi:hypothetical protein K504DRAFT_511742 [Pleomassaria siparia CBS 279.74]|uniref:Peptidase S8/S53 domain-containing protein n=1 Tax=Pleomassaria siparia CBS 279.74 TaxID=1314801 RepID=A0A6G1K5V9_9PLEO|nr:hypothetical protein K504DRAFT_511742 [Pleomassaria siparia CBS 279.74]
MPPKRSPIQLIRTSIQERDQDAFRDAVKNIKPGTFLIESWHDSLKSVLIDFPEADNPAFYLDALLRHGGDENDAHRRLLLNDEIARLGRYEDTEEEYRDEEMSQVAERILIQILNLYPDLAWTVPADTGRTLFHKAAEAGACTVIELVGDFVREHQGPEAIRRLVRIRDKANSQTALVIAVRGNKNSAVKAVKALMDLDPDQLDESNPNAQADIEYAVEGGKLHILKTLLQNRAHLVTPALFMRALFDSKYDILEYLVNTRPEMLQDTNANFLVAAVKKGQAKVVALLVDKFPDLTSQYELERDRRRYILSFNQDTYTPTIPGTRDKIRDLLLPVIIERNPISQIRDLLFDSSGKSEICLDLSAYSIDSSGLRRFLQLIDFDLSASNEKALPSEHFMSLVASLLDQQNIILTPELQDYIIQGFAIAENVPATSPEEFGKSSHVPLVPKSLPYRTINNQKPGFSRSDSFKKSTEISMNSEALSPSFNVSFEPTLKYVELPSFDEINATRREEAKDILDWLRKCKKVTRIFELRAKDSLHLAHSEETIEAALQGLDVQNLDWQRPDLSINTIRYAAPNVRILHLYSSGNWASIDHWLGPNGICTLPKLEKLYLTIASDNITPGRAKKYKEDAEQRLTEHKPGPGCNWKTPNVDIRPWQATRNPKGQTTTAEEHQTPIEITKLGYFLPQYKLYVNDADYGGDHDDYRIKVAIIDSGIDRCIFNAGDERNVTGASFVHNHDGSKESPWWLANDHHGSHIAHLIAQLDPCCSLYIAKVTENKSMVEKERVTQAIRWAINEKVDIINLSLVLYSEDSALLDAIENAHNAGIIVFCATADKGFTPQDIWPAKYGVNYDSIFPVCSSTANGRITEYSSETAAHYTFNGQDIIVDTGGTRVSGSSVATAIATGVASLVLTCHRILLSSQYRSTDRSLPGLSNKVAVIKKAFSKMCGDPVKQRPWLVTPSLLFPADRSEYALGEPDDVEGWLIERLQEVLTE